MRGDLLLYRSSGAWYQDLIVRCTHGPFVHVAIAIDDTKNIAAGGHGIAIFPYTHDDPHILNIPIALKHCTTQAVEQGIQWAETHVNQPYGWVDILAQAIKFLAPNNPFQLVQQQHWDCSDFATRYLQACGIMLPDMFSEPYANTPNDIARLFNLLPPRNSKSTSVI